MCGVFIQAQFPGFEGAICKSGAQIRVCRLIALPHVQNTVNPFQKSVSAEGMTETVYIDRYIGRSEFRRASSMFGFARPVCDVYIQPPVGCARPVRDAFRHNSGVQVLFAMRSATIRVCTSCLRCTQPQFGCARPECDVYIQPQFPRFEGAICMLVVQIRD